MWYSFRKFSVSISTHEIVQYATKWCSLILLPIKMFLICSYNIVALSSLQWEKLVQCKGSFYSLLFHHFTEFQWMISSDLVCHFHSFPFTLWNFYQMDLNMIVKLNGLMMCRWFQRDSNNETPCFNKNRNFVYFLYEKECLKMNL